MLKKTFLLLFLWAMIYGVLPVSAQLRPSASEVATDDSVVYVKGDDDYSLIMASWKGDIKSVKKLLARGANINATTDDGLTALIYSAEAGKYEMCYELIKAGADVNSRPISGRTALIAACRNNHRFVADLLLRNNAKPNQFDDFGRSALIYAASWADTGLVNLLLRSGADIKQRDFDGATPLIAACINDSLENVKLLIDKGADINAPDLNGMTPLLIAIGENKIDLAKLLIEKRADINFLNKNQQTPLSIAIQLDQENMVEFLIEKGADVNQKLSRAVTPLTIAKYYKTNNTIEFLLKDKDATQNAVPDFGRILIGPVFNWNFDDFMAGIDFGLRELKFGYDINVGFMARPFATRVWRNMDGQTFQFWEHKYCFSAGATKNFIFYNPENNIQTGLYMGAKAIYSIGSYRSASFTPSPSINLSPELGMLLIWRGVQFSLGYSYFDSNSIVTSPHRIDMGIKFIIGAKKHFEPKLYKKWEKRSI